MKKMSFKKARRISDILYAMAAAVVVYRVMFLGNDSPLSLPVLAAAIVLLIAGMIVYFKGCTCPNCGKIQPRYSKTECVDCHTKLQ